VPKEVGSIMGVLIVGVFWGCGGLRTGCRCCSTNQEEVLWHVFLKFLRKRGERADHTVNIELSFFSLNLLLFGYDMVTLGWILRATSLLPVC